MRSYRFRGRRCCTVGAAAWWMLVATGSLYAQPVPLDDPGLNLDGRHTERVVAPGLTHTQFVSIHDGGGLPVNAHILRIDLDTIAVRFALALDQILGQETTSAMVQRRHALAGVNGGFSFSNDPWNPYHGDPNGFFVLDGVVLSDPVRPRASFGICRDTTGRQTPVLVRPDLTIDLDAGAAGSRRATGINRSRGETDLIVYTPEWGRTTLTDSAGVEAVVVEGRVTAVRRGAGSTLIPEDGYVLSAAGFPATWLASALRPGLNVTRQIRVSDLDRPNRPVPLEGCSYTSAGPILIRNGEVVTDYTAEAFVESFTANRHPRTAVGISADRSRLFLVVVDGRQPGLSAGMTLTELARFLASLGAHEAYNLDGGGSSTLVVGDRVVNHPSDDRERRRCDALLLVPR